MFKYIRDPEVADQLWKDGLLYVANRGKTNWKLDRTDTSPSDSWYLDYAVLLED